MRDSDFKKLGHIVGSRATLTCGTMVSEGYKPDVTVTDAEGNLNFILESEQKTDRKAFLGDIIKALKYAAEREATPKLIIVMQPQSNTTIGQISKHLQSYVTWLNEKMGPGFNLSGIFIIEDNAYLASVNAAEPLWSSPFLLRGVTLNI